MSEKKPVPAASERAGNDCPVCGKRSYSPGGVHPQCAMLRADAPRKDKIAAEKKAKAAAKAEEA